MTRELIEIAYRRLKQHYEQERDYGFASYFHYGEKEMKRRREGLRRTPWLHLYWLLSGYGERLSRSFFWLISIWLLFATLYALYESGSLFDRLTIGLNTSLRGITRQSVDSKTFTTTILGIVGPAQIALFVLALRRRLMR